MRKVSVVMAFLISPLVTAIVFTLPEVVKNELPVRELPYAWPVFLPFAYAATVLSRMVVVPTISH